jgi:hypothetical protein
MTLPLFPGRVAIRSVPPRPFRWVQTIVVSMVMPACGPEGAGSIHIGPPRGSSVIIIPDRKAPMLPKVKARNARQVRPRSGRTIPNVSRPNG